MPIKIGNNFSYLGKKFLDDRMSVQTIEERNNLTNVPDGFRCFVRDTKKMV